MDGIEVGTTIDIKRTDGRIHEAVISSTNPATKSVTVEWLEKGETKGKEIDLATLLLVNPSLAKDSHHDTKGKVAKNEPLTGKLANRLYQAKQQEEGVTSSSESLNNIARHSPTPSTSSTQSAQHRKRRQMSNIPNSKLPVDNKSRTPSTHSSGSQDDELIPTATMTNNDLMLNDDDDDIGDETLVNAAKKAVLNQRRVVPHKGSNVVYRNGTTNMPPPRPVSLASTAFAQRSVSSTHLPTARAMTQTTTKGQLGRQMSVTNVNGQRTLTGRYNFANGAGGVTEDENAAPRGQIQNPPKTTVGAPGNTRKSVTVQEIEKLEKQREERRAQQEITRQKKEDLKNVDPGNRNWEFMGMIKDYRSQLEFRPLKANDRVDDRRISVCVRKRPLNKKEKERKEADVVTVPNKDHVIVHQPQTKVDLTKYLDNQSFRFDYAFDESIDNPMVYRFTAQPLVRTVFEGGFATCFAYGQTGSGKTHTMGGDFNGKVQDCTKGIYALTAKDIFKTLEKREYKKEDLYVSCSFFEIYSGKVFDLLNDKMKLRVLEDGRKDINIVGLTERECAKENDVLELISSGTDVRTAGQTSANNHSSRSHAVFQIMLRRRANDKLYGKFSLIDLAGNERGVDTMSSDRQTRMEGAEINKSLLALKECIRAMDRNSQHLPFRASKLTLVLRDSFIGSNARTCMIAMISPGLNSCEHTLNTCRYADRVKELSANGVDTNGGGGGEDYPMEPLDELGDEDSDLQLVQSRNLADLSDDLRSYQLAYNHIQEAEDRTLNEHTALIDGYEAAIKQLKKLMKTTEKVDYDMETYVREAKHIIAQLPSTSGFSREIENLESQIQQEEKIAQKSAPTGGTNKRR